MSHNTGDSRTCSRWAQSRRGSCTAGGPGAATSRLGLGLTCRNCAQYNEGKVGGGIVVYIYMLIQRDVSNTNTPVNRAFTYSTEHKSVRS